jgi:hypothetical protein
MSNFIKMGQGFNIFKVQSFFCLKSACEHANMMSGIIPNAQTIWILENLWRTRKKVRLKQDPKILVLRYVHNSFTWVRLKWKWSNENWERYNSRKLPLGKTNARKERIWKFCNLSKTMDGWMGGWRLWQIRLDFMLKFRKENRCNKCWKNLGRFKFMDGINWWIQYKLEKIASNSLLKSNKYYGWDEGWKIKDLKKLKCQKTLDEMEVRENKI